MIPNNTLSKFASNTFRYSPKGNGNRTKRQCLLSTSKANPGFHDQFLSFTDGSKTALFIEDRTRHDGIEAGKSSDSSFDDLQIVVTPALSEVQAFSGYFGAGPDVTAGFTGRDGHDNKRLGDY